MFRMTFPAFSVIRKIPNKTEEIGFHPLQLIKDSVYLVQFWVNIYNDCIIMNYIIILQASHRLRPDVLRAG